MRTRSTAVPAAGYREHRVAIAIRLLILLIDFCL